jgi:hypothetical protein
MPRGSVGRSERQAGPKPLATAKGLEVNVKVNHEEASNTV